MRGKELKSPKLRTKTGITPAYAGKSCRSAFTFSTMSDHPRLCGEKFDQLFNVMCAVGSPPPMRGKASSFENPADCSGITPAYAGKSVLQLCQRHEHRDHPRLCGEKQTGDSDAVKIMGSPPPMRGKEAGIKRL